MRTIQAFAHAFASSIALTDVYSKAQTTRHKSQGGESNPNAPAKALAFECSLQMHIPAEDMVFTLCRSQSLQTNREVYAQMDIPASSKSSRSRPCGQDKLPCGSSSLQMSKNYQGVQQKQIPANPQPAFVHVH